MAMSLDELTQKLHQETYVPRTDEQLKSEAENRYSSIYNQKKLTAQQNYDASDLAYQKELQSLADTLALNQQTLQKETANSIASANRYQITRGMQRSSYGAANNARLEAVGDTNLAQLLRQYSTEAGSIENNRTLLAQQLADTLAQYDIDYLSDINAYIDEQKQLDYDRQVAAQQYANDLNIQLYQLAQAAAKSSGGGSRRSSGGSYYPTNPGAEDPGNGTSIFDDLDAAQKLVSDLSSAAIADRMQKQSKTTYTSSASAKAKSSSITGNVAKKQQAAKNALSAAIAGRNNR